MADWETRTGIASDTSKLERVFNSLTVFWQCVCFLCLLYRKRHLSRDICVADVAPCEDGSALVASLSFFCFDTNPRHLRKENSADHAVGRAGSAMIGRVHGVGRTHIVGGSS